MKHNASPNAAHPTVSVIVPCLNREHTVHAAVMSVLVQDFSDLELIVVDDNSNDGSRRVLEAIEDPRLRIATNPGPRGQSRAENIGIALARGRWIAFQDSDDFWRPGKLTAQIARLSEGGFVAAYCAMAVRDGSRGKGVDAPVLTTVPGPEAIPKEGDILPALRHRSIASTQTLVIAAEVLDRVGGWNEEYTALNDWDLMFRIAKLGPVAYVPEIYVDQVIMPDSVSRSDRARLEAYYRILSHHGDEIGKDRTALAKMHNRIAGAHRRFSEFFDAGVHARRAAQLRPTPRQLGLATYTSLRQVLNRAISGSQK